MIDIFKTSNDCNRMLFQSLLNKVTHVTFGLILYSIQFFLISLTGKHMIEGGDLKLLEFI